MGGFYEKFGKRLLDLVIVFPACIFLWMPAIILALLVLVYLGTPILFRQIRPGKHGRPFTIYKFRSMADKRGPGGNFLPDEKRLTPFGKFLRAASLDELPELFNVLQGNMSLVGPRPLLMKYLDRYTPEQARRHAIKPGMTGWAQVNGRNAITWEQKFALDVWYIDHLCFSLDLKIIALTIWKIIRKEGIHQPGQATALEFNPQTTQPMTDASSEDTTEHD